MSIILWAPPEPKGRNIPVNAVAKTLDPARGEAAGVPIAMRRMPSSWRKSAIVHARPSLGYRRVTGLLSRRLRTEGRPTVNAKRVLRIMQHHGLTLERHTASQPGGTHDGVGIALHSNVRWCSDHLEIHARNR